MDGKYTEATQLVQDALKTEKEQSKRIRLIYLLSAIQRMDEDYSKAIANLQQVLEAQPKPTTPEQHFNHVVILKRIGDCYYGQRKTQPALQFYKSALAELDAVSADAQLTVPLLEAIVGTQVYAKQYNEAEGTAKRLLEITGKRENSENLEDIGALFWARLQMLGVYRHLGKDAERKKLWEQSNGMLDRLLSLRAKLDASESLSDYEKVRKDFEEAYINEFHPQSPAEYLWLAAEFRMRSLPLIQWKPADKARAAILCIHGLGLENRAFTSFGREMAQRGYSVYALDVRGFGAWQSTQGQEDVQFKETLKDIGSVLTLISRRENGLPTFLLGESMGGAIALRGAADYGNSIAGVISSVPSAERFQDRRMGLTVAFHLLQGKNKPFRVGDMVTDQATKNEALAERWKADSKAKMDMSPKELIKFAVFMRTTKGECEKITCPVFVIQGLKDRLVKPQGSYDLFEAVKGADKNLLLLGTAEHLIFETFTPSKLLVDALCTWMDEHTLKAPPAK
jgi:alpha-beta hydrolase superfamily lysophospholipase